MLLSPVKMSHLNSFRCVSPKRIPRATQPGTQGVGDLEVIEQEKIVSPVLAFQL